MKKLLLFVGVLLPGCAGSSVAPEGIGPSYGPAIPPESHSTPTPEPPPEPNWITHFAPVWFHDAASQGSAGYSQDYFARYDYDGDLDHSNNWDNLEAGHALTATIYASHVATESHVFLTYTQYHPRDWEIVCTGLFKECHEGDLEHVFILVDRVSRQPVQIVTSAHGYEISWTPDQVDFEDETHVRIYTQEKGHGVIPCTAEQYAPFGGFYGFMSGVHCDAFMGGDGIVFAHSDGVATLYEDSFALDVARVDYALVDYVDTFWAHRFNSELFEEFDPETGIGIELRAEQFPVDVSGRLWWEVVLDPAPGAQYIDYPF